MSDILELILVLVPVAGIIFLRFFIKQRKPAEEETVKNISPPVKKVFIPETRAVSRIHSSGINKASEKSSSYFRQSQDANHHSISESGAGSDSFGSRKQLIPERLRRMSELQRAVIMSEILGAPKALRHTQEGGR
ncbi:hypothetical protein [Spirochaeta dissipatitropha]